MTDCVTCPHCDSISNIGGLIGPQTNDCPVCGKRIIQPMISRKALEKSLYWQNVVFKQSKDQKQIERCRLAIAKLEAQLKELLQSI